MFSSDPGEGLQTTKKSLYVILMFLLSFAMSTALPPPEPSAS